MSKKLKASDFAVKFAKEYGYTQKQAKQFVADFSKFCTKELTNGTSFLLSGLGSFYGERQEAKRVRNPKTGYYTDTPSRIVPKFKFSTKVVEKIKKDSSI